MKKEIDLSAPFDGFRVDTYLDTCSFTAQKKNFFIKDFFSKWDQIRRKLRIWSHLLRRSLIENFIFCAVFAEQLINQS